MDYIGNFLLKRISKIFKISLIVGIAWTVLIIIAMVIFGLSQ
jgi:hypothetical protein